MSQTSSTNDTLAFNREAIRFKIRCIKEVRESAGVGLVDAKAAVELAMLTKFDFRSIVRAARNDLIDQRKHGEVDRYEAYAIIAKLQEKNHTMAEQLRKLEEAVLTLETAITT